MRRPWASRALSSLAVLSLLTWAGWGSGWLSDDVTVTSAAPESPAPSPTGWMAAADDAPALTPGTRAELAPTTTASSSTTSVPRATPSRTASTSRAAATTAKAAPRGVRADRQTLPDLAYAGSSGAQKLDLYLPDRTGTAVPLVILIHGGAFMSGDKTDEAELARSLQDRGLAVASVNYRLSGEARFPAGVQDVKAAVRWLRAHAAAHGIHPDRFAAWGSSAGGYLAVMLGVTGGQRTTLDDASLGNAGVSSAVQLVVDLYGPADLLSMDEHAADPGGCAGGAQVHDAPDSPESLWLGAPIQSVPALGGRANPIGYLDTARRLPAFVIAHGNRDCLVPYGQSVQLGAALRKAGASVSLTVVDGAGHGSGEFAGLYPPAVKALGRWAPPPS